MMEPLKIPLVIVGTKFDLYQELDPEKKKVIAKTLRFVAHTYGASLLVWIDPLWYIKYCIMICCLLTDLQIIESQIELGMSSDQSQQQLCPGFTFCGEREGVQTYNIEKLCSISYTNFTQQYYMDIFDRRGRGQNIISKVWIVMALLLITMWIFYLPFLHRHYFVFYSSPV